MAVDAIVLLAVTAIQWYIIGAVIRRWLVRRGPANPSDVSITARYDRSG
jgi:hypothetical protein